MRTFHISALALGLASVVLAGAGQTTAAPAPVSDAEAAATAIAIISSAFPKAAFPTAVPKASGRTAYLNLGATNGRSQVVYLNGLTYGSPTAKVRIISSQAALITGPVDATLATRLLTDNYAGLPYGFWALSKVTPAGQRALYYEVEVRDAIPAAAVQSIMATVARTADALEAELTGKDVF